MHTSPDPLDPERLAELDAALGTERDAEGLPLPGPRESLDLLAGAWRIFQLTDGHRFSTDDLLTAWMSARLSPNAANLLDIGAGIGSVGLLALFKRPDSTRLTMVEAQSVSHRLARKTIEFNRLQTRVAARLGDLRDPQSLPEAEQGGYDAVTGSPPYIPLGSGHVSPHPQRAACRMELRGDVFDYANTAARALTPDGVFCLCHAAFDPRPEAAIAQAGLHLWRRLDVWFRRNRAPTISLYAAGHGPPAPGQLETLPERVVIREADGAFTRDYLLIRAEMGGPELRPRSELPR